MTAKRPAPRTVREFRREAVRVIREHHPDAEHLAIEFGTGQHDRPRRVHYPTGHVGFAARVTISADGYRTTSGTVTADDDSIMFRPSPTIDVSGVTNRRNR